VVDRDRRVLGLVTVAGIAAVARDAGAGPDAGDDAPRAADVAGGPGAVAG
jgi:hypothetical protein